METECGIAFKEWAVVCAALASGRQTVILRKGGIDEGREGFRVAHSQFWLFPTQFHQTTDQVQPEAIPLFERARQEWEVAGRHRLNLLAEVQQTFWIDDRATLAQLQPFHILSSGTVEQRFDYRQPGLFVLLVRMYKSSSPQELADDPYFAGCRSWVELRHRLSTAAVEPVLTDDAFERQHRALAESLTR